jgi:hypothetical protein
VTATVSVCRRSLVAGLTHGPSVRQVEPLLRVERKRQDVVSVQPDAMAREGVIAAVLAGVVVACEDVRAPLSVLRALPDSFVDGRYTTLPVRAVLPADSRRNQTPRLLGMPIAGTELLQAFVPRLTASLKGACWLPSWRTNTRTQGATAGTEAADFGMTTGRERLSATLASLQYISILHQFTQQKAVKVGEAVHA